MIAYLALGTRDFSRAVESCKQLLPEMWAQRVVQMADSFSAWGLYANAASLSVIKPFVGGPATA